MDKLMSPYNRAMLKIAEAWMRYITEQLRNKDSVTPTQPSVSCCRCGKAMEDRGAAYQWCGECCDKVAKA